jgi:hypothetical protein
MAFDINDGIGDFSSTGMFNLSGNVHSVCDIFELSKITTCGSVDNTYAFLCALHVHMHNASGDLYF